MTAWETFGSPKGQKEIHTACERLVNEGLLQVMPHCVFKITTEEVPINCFWYLLVLASTIVALTKSFFSKDGILKFVGCKSKTVGQRLFSGCFQCSRVVKTYKIYVSV